MSTPPAPTLPRKRGRETITSTSSERRVSLWRRLAALFYDVLPLMALWMIAAFAYLLALRGRYDPRHPHWAMRLGLQSALLAVTAAYFMISWTRIGQTIGMRAWRLKLQREDGGAIGAWRALARFVLALTSLLLAGAGFWWALFDAEKRTLHDRVCRTVMVRL